MFELTTLKVYYAAANGLLGIATDGAWDNKPRLVSQFILLERPIRKVFGVIQRPGMETSERWPGKLMVER